MGTGLRARIATTAAHRSGAAGAEMTGSMRPFPLASVRETSSSQPLPDYVCPLLHAWTAAGQQPAGGRSKADRAGVDRDSRARPRDVGGCALPPWCTSVQGSDA
jgi:hypothetical protein